MLLQELDIELTPKQSQTETDQERNSYNKAVFHAILLLPTLASGITKVKVAFHAVVTCLSHYTHLAGALSSLNITVGWICSSTYWITVTWFTTIATVDVVVIWCTLVTLEPNYILSTLALPC